MTHTQRLATLIGDKYACLVQLRDLGLKQKESIESSDLARLLRLLATKQHFLGVLHGIERSLAPFRDEDPEGRVWSTAEDRVRCAEQAAACRVLLDQIVGQERENEGLMLAQREAAAERLHVVEARSRAGTAYRQHMRGRAPDGGDRAARASAGPDCWAQGAATTALDVSSDIHY
jgi:hypothetical protein